MRTPTNSLFTAIGYVAVGFVVFLLVGSFFKRREGILHWVRRTVQLELTYIGVTLVVAHWQPILTALLSGLLAAMVLDKFLPRRRTRHIRASVRRRVIARYEMKTGEKFDPQKHELDHVIPYSSGGSHTSDNLKVLTKQKNRSKGPATPWWDLLGRR